MNRAAVRAVLAPVPERDFLIGAFIDPARPACRCASGHLIVANGLSEDMLCNIQPPAPTYVYSNTLTHQLHRLRLTFGVDLYDQLQIEHANDGTEEWEHLRWVTTPKQRVLRLLSDVPLPWDQTLTECARDGMPGWAGA